MGGVKMSKNFSDILKELREEKGLNQQQLANSLEVTRQTISNYENNKRVPNKEMLEIIADFFNVDMNYLYGQSEIKNKYQDFFSKYNNIIPIKKGSKKIPLLGTIAAGNPILAEEHIDEYIDFDEKVQADFCLRVKGDSMINANIKSGDIVFIKKQSDVDDGEIAAVLIDGEATLKRVYKIGDVIQLRAENPSFPPITLDGSVPTLILGKATYKLSKVL